MEVPEFAPGLSARVELTVTDSSGLSCGQATDRTVVTVRRRSPMLVTETPAAGPRE